MPTVDDDSSASYLLASLREREHILQGVIRAQEEWRQVLEVVHASEDADDARDRLCSTLGFTHDQATQVVHTQFRRVTRIDRQRMAAEQVEVQARIQALEARE